MTFSLVDSSGDSQSDDEDRVAHHTLTTDDHNETADDRIKHNWGFRRFVEQAVG